MPINGRALAAGSAGLLFLWSGTKGTSVTHSLKDLIGGHAPSKTQTTGITGTPASAVAGSTGGSVPVSNSAIANAALAYQGHPYRYGGAPGPNGTNPWDCSSCFSWVIGHDLMYPIPGYPHGYDGLSHGPTTGQYMVWSGAVTIPRSQVQAGDMCVWSIFHMGIAISNTAMISAQDPQDGTRISSINGGGPGPLTCRRLR